MQINSVKEKAISAIQRDSLDLFLKKSFETNSGCLFYSLLTAWENLYPEKQIPKEFLNELNNKSYLNIHSSLISREIRNLLPTLRIGIKEIIINPIRFSKTGKDIFREKNNVQFYIPIKFSTTGEPDLNNSQVSLILMSNQEHNVSHMICSHKSSRFKGLEADNGNIGGIDGINHMPHYDFLAQYYLEKAE